MNRFESKTALNTKTATNAWELKILIVGGAVSRTSAGKTWPGLCLRDVARETKPVLKKMLHQKGSFKGLGQKPQGSTDVRGWTIAPLSTKNAKGRQ